MPYLDTSVRRVLDSSKQVVVRRVKRHSKRTIHNPAIDVDPKINLHNIAVLQNNLLLPRIRGVVRNAVVQREPRREPQSGLETLTGFQAGITKQRSHAVLDIHGDIRQRLARTHALLRPAPDLAVDFGCFAIVVQEAGVVVAAREIPGFLWRCASRPVILDLAGRVLASREEVAQGDPGRRRLL